MGMHVSNRPATYSLAATLVLGLAVAGCSTTHSRSQQTSSSPAILTPASPLPAGSVNVSNALQPAGNGVAGYSYSLSDLRSCDVGDGLTVLENQAAQPISITGIAVNVTSDSTGLIQRSVQVMEVKAGTIGEVAASFTLSKLPHNPLHPAADIALAPVASSHMWYVLVAHLHLLGKQPKPWSINSLSVTYKLGQQSHTTDFTQSVHLAAENTCGS